MPYELYVELLKRAVSGYLYLDMDDLALLPRPDGTMAAASTCPMEEREALRKVGGDWPNIAYAMSGLARLDNLEFCLRTAVLNGVPGDFIETGVWRGGTTIFGTGVLRALGQRERATWVADSFDGLPPPKEEQYPEDRGSNLHTFEYLKVPRQRVERAFERFGLLDKRVRFIEGYFEETLKKAPIKRLCVARLDGDMYSSTMAALEALYHKISPGGFLIVDDYALPPCKKAVTDFRASKGIDARIQTCDWTGVFWQIPPA